MGSALNPAIAPISDAEFRQFQALVHAEAGIWLSDAKRALLVGRLSRRVRQLGLSSFGQYRRLLVESRDPDERQHMIDCVCTNETHFFREPKHFDHLEAEVFPRWRSEADARQKSVRLWSAACSTGQEPYTLAMLLAYHFPARFGWRCEILGTDVSTRALAQARSATWPIDKLNEIPKRFVKRCLLRGVGREEGRMRARPELRDLVTLRQLNLHAEPYDVGEPFDAIFCRNVLIYFQPDDKARIIQRLAQHLRPDGLLFLGHAETVSGSCELLRSVMPTVYVKR